MILGKGKTFNEFQSSFEPIGLEDTLSMRTYKNLSSSLSKTSFRTQIQPSSRKYEIRSKCLIDSESLKIQNNSLKSKLGLLENDNIQLKRRIIDLEQEFALKEKNSEYFGFSSTRAVPNLKITFKKCRSRLNLKESLAEELKAKMRTKRAMDAEDEIKDIMEECIKLKNMLINAIFLINNPKEYTLAEDRIQILNEDLANLRGINEEYYVTLEEINNEIFQLTTHEKFLEKSKKKKNKKKTVKVAEYKQKKVEVGEVVEELGRQTKDIKDKETEIQEKLKQVSATYEESHKKLMDIENQLKKKTEENEKVKNLNTSYRNALRKARTMNVLEEDTPRKLKNPPKFFKSIHKITKQKNMMIEVFLSLFDKFNKRILTIEEFYTASKANIKGIKRKFIENALKIIGISENYISLDIIEEWYNKYDYDSINEDIVNPIEIKRTSMMSPKESQILFARKVKTSSNNNFLSTLSQSLETNHKLSQDLLKIFDDIALRMEKNRIPKGKITETLFGEDFDESLPIFSEDLEQRLSKSKLNLNNFVNNKILAQFLCEPEEEIKDITEKSPKFSQISKKLKKYTHDWEIFAPAQRLTIKLAIYKQIKKNSHSISKKVKEKFGKNKEKISWSEFKEVLLYQGINLQEEIWRFWSLKFYPEGQVEFKMILRKFKTSFPAEDSINLIKERKKYRNLHITDIFNIDINGLITVAEFAGNVKKLYLGLHSKDVLELICFIQDKFKSFHNESFTTANLIEVFN